MGRDFALAVGAGFVGFFAWHAVQLTYDFWRFNDMAQGVVAIPLWIPQLGYPGGLVILSSPSSTSSCTSCAATAALREAAAATAEEVVERAIQSGV